MKPAASRAAPESHAIRVWTLPDHLTQRYTSGDGSRWRFKPGPTAQGSVFIYLALGNPAGSRGPAVAGWWSGPGRWFGPSSTRKSHKIQPPPPPPLPTVEGGSERGASLTLEEFCSKLGCSDSSRSSAHRWDFSLLETPLPSTGKMLTLASGLASLTDNKPGSSRSYYKFLL